MRAVHGHRGPAVESQVEVAVRVHGDGVGLGDPAVDADGGVPGRHPALRVEAQVGDPVLGEFAEPQPAVVRVEGDAVGRGQFVGQHRGLLAVAPDPHHAALRLPLGQAPRVADVQVPLLVEGEVVGVHPCSVDLAREEGARIGPVRGQAHDLAVGVVGEVEPSVVRAELGRGVGAPVVRVDRARRLPGHVHAHHLRLPGGRGDVHEEQAAVLVEHRSLQQGHPGLFVHLRHLHELLRADGPAGTGGGGLVAGGARRRLRTASGEGQGADGGERGKGPGRKSSHGGSHSSCRFVHGVTGQRCPVGVTVVDGRSLRCGRSAGQE